MSASLETLEDVETLVRRLLSCIDPVEISRAVRWDGKAFRLSQHIKNSQQLDTALLHILSHRWLPTFRYRPFIAAATQSDRPQWGSYGRGVEMLCSSALFAAF